MALCPVLELCTYITSKILSSFWAGSGIFLEDYSDYSFILNLLNTNSKFLSLFILITSLTKPNNLFSVRKTLHEHRGVLEASGLILCEFTKLLYVRSVGCSLMQNPCTTLGVAQVILQKNCRPKFFSYCKNVKEM